MANENALSRDKEAYYKKKPSHAEYIRHASVKSKRGPISLALEFAKLARGRGKITLPEYVQYGIYDPNLSYEEKSRFITDTLHWSITCKCCDMTWQAVTEDKWLCSHVLNRSNIPVPPVLAVIDTTERNYPGTRKIKDARELKEFALAQQGEPFFGKETRGICGFGVFLVLEAEQDRLHLKGEGWMDYETFLDSFVGSTSYLLQALQRNHKFFDAYTENLATVRVCILVADDCVKIPFAALKLPVQENIADSFWRPGNIVCDVDPATGRIMLAKTKDVFSTTSHTTHPQSGAPLVGETIPAWDKLLALVHSCAPIFAPVRYQSMDVAITENGPVLIEVNTGGSFALLQLASGRGLLTDEVCEFFRFNGYNRL